MCVCNLTHTHKHTLYTRYILELIKLKWKKHFLSDINTLLSRETARETQVLNSSGFFWLRHVIREMAAVTTPWMNKIHKDNYFITNSHKLRMKWWYAFKIFDVNKYKVLVRRLHLSESSFQIIVIRHFYSLKFTRIGNPASGNWWEFRNKGKVHWNVKMTLINPVNINVCS